MNNVGLIVKGVAGVFDVRIGDTFYSASAKGSFRNKKVTPLVGDKVKIKFAERADEYNLITEILPRKNSLIRPPVANIDTLIITIAVKRPNPDLKLVDYLICYARMLNITPIVCINKIDYDTEEAERIKLQYEQSSIKTFLTSAIDAECINRLKNAIGEGITCFTGQSAVGKSTLTNGLLGHEAFRTGGLSKKTERGKHTTRHTELVMFDTEKFLVDTPGFSLIELPSLSPEDFKDLYYEYNDYIDECRFNGCNHINEPVCGVKNAVECGELSKERYERYRQLFQEIEENWRKRYD